MVKLLANNFGLKTLKRKILKGILFDTGINEKKNHQALWILVDPLKLMKKIY